MNPADPALLAAIQFLSKQVANLPMATIAASGSTSAVQRTYVTNSNWAAPVPVVIEGGGTGGGKGKEEPSSATGGPMNRTVRGITAVGNTIGAAFGSLLGPLGTLTTFLTSATSGFQVFSGALALFAQSVGPVIMPVLFTLAVGLASAADTVQKKLMPAMDSFTKWVLSTGLPAMQQFAEAVGKAAQVLALISENKIARFLVGASESKGGYFGAFNRTTDGVMGNTVAGPESDGTTAGDIKAAHRFVDDLAETFGGRPGRQAAEAKNWLMQESWRQVYGNDNANPYSGPGVQNGEGADKQNESNAQGAKAARKVLAELQFQLNPKTGVGDLRSSFRNAQQSALAMSPFQRETLELQRKEIALLEKALAGYEKTGVYTRPGEAAATTSGETTGWLAGLAGGR